VLAAQSGGDDSESEMYGGHRKQGRGRWRSACRNTRTGGLVDDETRDLILTEGAVSALRARRRDGGR
jgi:hypothetical protein